MGMNDEDGILIKKYLKGDEDAFTQLVEKYIDAVYAFSLRLSGDPHTAEDATQQVFINAWKRLASYDTNRRFLTWLLAIAHNASVDILRKKKGVPLSYFDSAEGGNAILDTTKDPEPLPDDLFARNELGEELGRALAILSFAEREVLTLHYEEGLTFEEISEMLGKSRNTVKSQQRRAVEKLRALLLPSQT